MAVNEALERSGDDIKEKLAAFDALATRDNMKLFLVQLNATIPKFKDRVRLTGSKPELKSRYHQYLLRSAELPVTNTATTPSAKRSATAQQSAAPKRVKREPQTGDDGEMNYKSIEDTEVPQLAAPKRVKREHQAGDDGEMDYKSIDDTEALQPAAPKREKRTQQAGESEAVGDKSTDNTQDMMSSMLSRLFVADRVQLSTSTITCLGALGSPLSAVAARKPENGDLSSRLWPLVDPISTLISARDSIIATHSYLDNLGRLAAAIRTRPVTAPACFSSFLACLHSTFIVDRGDAGDTLAVPDKEPEDTSLDEAAVMAEVDVLSNEVNRALAKWSSSFPSPPSDSMIYPVDFNQTERIELRGFARKYIEKYPHLSKLGIAREVLLATSEDILATGPIERGEKLKTAMNVSIEARKNVNLVKGKPPSTKSPDCEVGDKEEEGEKTDKPKARRRMPVVAEVGEEEEEDQDVVTIAGK
ncbi:uncharacterized protein J4E92_005607 [Alternaria infectoria]|uniref:uncharacterized protein n=1 Tax=Alternaria infectoria TaxID=45303 RepID=UPI0022209E61|nr:uncharacterized protein J4E92_005607 [Alternaria infectoria]KAI4928124.1 hypothetical protein J4E92_005607 [Alternaria infectoria]